MTINKQVTIQIKMMDGFEVRGTLRISNIKSFEKHMNEICPGKDTDIDHIIFHSQKVMEID